MEKWKNVVLYIVYSSIYRRVEENEMKLKHLLNCIYIFVWRLVYLLAL